MERKAPERGKNLDSSNPNAGSFASLGLSPLFSGSLKERNILYPTEIQRHVIPRLLAGESFIFRSATGTGKTFAYLLPLLERLVGLLGDNGEAAVLRGKPLLLVAAPTFELCSQIKSEADFLLRAVPFPVRTALFIGSAALGRQVELLKKERPGLIVGNPGRILALARQGKLKLGNIRFLVLDEGDRLVQDELFEETREMVSLLKQPLQATACSATFPAKSRQRLLPLLGIPEPAASTDHSREVNRSSPPVSNEAVLSSDDSILNVLREKIEHWAFFSPEREKIDLLRSLLAALDAAGGKRAKAERGAVGKKIFPVKALIFSGRAGQVENIAARLRSHKLPAAALSGGMDKTGRRQALAAFRSGQIRFLVSSDLAARGLDISGISHVIALDVNEDRDVYLHRAGRTARAGKSGVMISIGTEGEMRRLAALEKTLGLTVYPKVLFGGRILAPEPEEEQ